MRAIIKRCQKSPSFFCEQFTSIEHPKLGIIPFKLFNYQKKAFKSFLSHRFNIFKKVRQCGASTMTGAFALWYGMFYNNKNILIVSKRDDDAKDFLRRNVKVLHDSLPDWMKNLWPRIVDNEHEIIFPNKSRIKSLTSSKDTLRSQAASLNIIDEAAFIPDMESMWRAGASTLSHGGSAICISTVNGIGNWYWQAYTDAEGGLNDFNPIKIDWWDMDWKLEIKDELSGHINIIAPTEGIRKCTTPDEIEKYGPFWSPWLEQQYRQLAQKGDPLKFRQEVLAEFVGTGNTVLGRQSLLDAQMSIVDDFKKVSTIDYNNPYVGELTTLNFNNQLWLWNPPIKDRIYSMGVDTSTGDANDFSTIVVVDVIEQEQVAEVQIKTIPSVFARMVDYIGRYYNNAFAVVERSGIGVGVCNDLHDTLKYQNMYRKPKKNSFNKDIKYGEVGFNTTTASKPMLNKLLIDGMVPDGWKIKSSRLAKELLIYVNLGNGRTGAENGKGNNDDLVMAFMLAIFGASNAVLADQEPLIPMRDTGMSNVTGSVGDTLSKYADLIPPVAVNMNDKHKLSIEQEISKFARQIGGIPIDQVKIDSVSRQKYTIKRKK
jgi:hypothetical protein